MSQFRYAIRPSKRPYPVRPGIVYDVRDSAIRAGARAALLAAEYGEHMEVVRGDAGGDKTRVCEVAPDGHATWFIKPSQA